MLWMIRSTFLILSSHDACSKVGLVPLFSSLVLYAVLWINAKPPPFLPTLSDVDRDRPSLFRVVQSFHCVCLSLSHVSVSSKKSRE